MPWNYSGDPNSSNKDRVRFYCGDTNSADPLLQDEEIFFLIVLRGSPERAAQDAALAIMAKMSREADYYIGPERVWASQRLANYKILWDSLRTALIGLKAAPSWDDPAISEPTKTPVFDLGMHDNHTGGDNLDG